MLQPIDIREIWNNIKDKLADLREACHCDWRVEDVYHSCRSGESDLWVADDAFTVIRNVENEFTGQPELYIWIFVGDGLVRDKYIPQLEQIARSIGAKKMRMVSPRKGFTRTGWEIDSINYVRAL